MPELSNKQTGTLLQAKHSLGLYEGEGMAVTQTYGAWITITGQIWACPSEEFILLKIPRLFVIGIWV